MLTSFSFPLLLSGTLGKPALGQQETTLHFASNVWNLAREDITEQIYC